MTATGQIPEVIGRPAAGERVGTLFPAPGIPWKGARAGSWSWAPPHGEVGGGSGAVAAMQEKGLQPPKRASSR